MDPTIAEQLAIRDRFRIHQWRMLTPEQRVEAMKRQQELSRRRLRSNPVAYERWFRLQWRNRAVSRGAGGSHDVE